VLLPIAPPASVGAASPGTATLEIGTAPDAFAANSVVAIGAMFETNIMVISATIAEVKGVAS
jgi:hypothetical protein